MSGRINIEGLRGPTSSGAELWYKNAAGIFLPVSGSVAVGKAPVGQADGSIAWETPAGGGGGGSAGGMTFLTETVGSAASAIACTGWYTSAIDHYVVVCKNVQPSSNQIVYLQVSTDNGATWLTSAIYRWVIGYAYPGGDGKDNGTDIGIPLRNAATPVAATEGYNFTFNLIDPGSTTLRKQVYGLVHSPASDLGLIPMHLSCSIETTSAINAVRLVGASGTISGTLRMYAMQKTPSPGVTRRVLLAKLTAAGSASLNLTTRNKSGLSGAIFQSDYRKYEFDFNGIRPATNAANFNVQFSTDGGASWITASVYTVAQHYFYTGGTGANNVSGTAGSVAGALSNGSAHGYDGRGSMVDPTDGTRDTTLHTIGINAADTNVSNLPVRNECMTRHDAAAAVNAAKFFMSTGNIAVGDILCWGIDDQ